MKNIFTLFLAVATFSVLAQPAATSAQDLTSGVEKMQQLSQNSIVKNLPFKN